MTIQTYSGTSRQDRNNRALQPGYVSADGRSELQLLQKARTLACESGFSGFLPANDAQLAALLSYAESPDTEILRRAGLGPGLQPHLQLFMVFLQLLRQPQQQFEQLTRQYQDYYYQTHLQFSAKPAIADNVYLTVALADGIERCVLNKGTLFDAGQDKAGQPRHYALVPDLVPDLVPELTQQTVVNACQLDEVRLTMNEENFVSLLYQSDKDKTFTPISLALQPDNSRPKLVNKGLIIGSPLLFLAEGKRTITLTGLPKLSEDHAVFISTKGGWSEQIDSVEGITLTLNTEGQQEITINADFEPIVPIENSQLTPAIAITGADVTCPESLKLSVEVKGLTSIKMRSEHQIFNGDGSFKPFAIQPQQGAKFYFANAEICSKPVTKLCLSAQWLPGAVRNTPEGMPNLTTIYQHYVDEHNTEIDVGTYKVSLLSSNHQVCSVDNPDLFSAQKLTFSFSGSSAMPADLISDGDDPLSWPSYFQLELTEGDFYDELYVSSLTYQQQKAIADTTTKITKQDDGTVSTNTTANHALTVYPPYTPEIGALSIDYTATQSIGDQGSRIYLINGREASEHMPAYFDQPGKTGTALKDSPVVALTTQAINVEVLQPQLLTPVEPWVFERETAELLFKVSRCGPGQEIRLLVELETTGPVKLDDWLAQETSRQQIPQPGAFPEVNWHYLADNQWQPLPVSEDQTKGLRQSGLFVFELPLDTDVTDQAIWLKAEIAGALAAIPKIINVHTQAIEVQYQPDEQPVISVDTLPAQSIQALVQPQSDIKAVAQPLASTGGSSIEHQSAMNTRISEQLHHRGRALCRRDYELLVLQQFKQITHVSCINTTENGNKKQASIGLLVIPEIEIQPSGQLPKIPVADISLLNAIKDFMTPLCPQGIDIQVSNIAYKKLTCVLDVDFIPQGDHLYYRQQLAQVVTERLMPWAYQPDTSLAGVAINKDIVITQLANRLVKEEYLLTINRLALNESE